MVVQWSSVIPNTVKKKNLKKKLWKTAKEFRTVDIKVNLPRWWSRTLPPPPVWTPATSAPPSSAQKENKQTNMSRPSKVYNVIIKAEHWPALVLGGPSDESPVNTDGLTHHILTIQPFHRCLGLFVGLIFHQCISLKPLMRSLTIKTIINLLLQWLIKQQLGLQKC